MRAVAEAVEAVAEAASAEEAVEAVAPEAVVAEAAGEAAGTVETAEETAGIEAEAAGNSHNSKSEMTPGRVEAPRFCFLENVL